MKHYPATQISSALSVLALACVACGIPQVDGDYRGEPLATVRGSINSDLTQPVREAYAALIWPVKESEADVGDPVVGESVEVNAEFPAQLELDLFLPPPEEALFDLPGRPDRIALAFIVILDRPVEELDLTQDEAFDDVVLGGAEDHILVYADGALPNLVLDIVHGPLPSGYALMRAEKKTPEDLDALDQCYEQAETEEEENACGSFHDQLYPVSDPNAPIQLDLRDDVSNRLPNII